MTETVRRCSCGAPGASLAGDTVDERAGLLNAINVLHARVPDAVPMVTFRRTVTGRYQIEFDFSPRVTAIIKETVPAAVRRWRRGAKHWEISADWAGPLVAALRNAGHDGSRTSGVAVRGLSELDVSQASWWCLAPMPIGKAGHQAYLEGRCVVCTRRPHRAGDLACEKCHGVRLARACRVRDVLANRGPLPWPTAVPSAGDALRCCYPLLWDGVDADAVDGVHDYTAAVDATILAVREGVDKPPCPICGRRPAKGAVVHVACRRHLLATLANKPFNRARSKAYQADQCVVCLRRLHRAGQIACEHCAHLLHQIKETDK